MQQRNLGKAMRYLMAVCALVSALAMFGCGDGGDDETTARPVSNVAVPTSASSVQGLVRQQFIIPDGSAFFPGLPSTPLTLSFTSPTTFTLTSGNSMATGTLAFGSCTFTVSTSTIGGLQAPPSVTIPTFQTCNFVVTAIAPLEAGGATGQATIILQLARPGGTPINFTLLAGTTITVSITPDGQLIINGGPTGITIPPTTGTTGTGGTP